MSRLINGGGNASTFPDIHGIMDSNLIRYPITTRFSVSDKQRIIGSLADLVRERANPQVREFGVNGLQIIARDAGQSSNWQGADGLFACDVLAEICALLVGIEDDEIVDTAINHLCEQSADMIKTGGLCPSGRLRCFQVYMILKDYVDGIHLPSGSDEAVCSISQ